MTDDQAARGRKRLLHAVTEGHVKTSQELTLLLWERASEELCACDHEAATALGHRIVREWQDYGLTSDAAKELMRCLHANSAYKSFEESQLGFQSEMFKNAEMAKSSNRASYYRLMADSITSWRQWWLEHSSIRTLTDFESMICLFKMTKWLVENGDL